MGILIDTISWLLLLGGAVFMIIGGVGINRMPDVYTRLHAAGVTDTLGAGLVLIGLMLQAGLTLVTVKLCLILVFLLFTSPVSSHALARAALHGDVNPILHRVEESPPSK